MGGAPKKEELENLARSKLIKINAAGASQITTEGRNFLEKAMQDLGLSRFASSYEFAELLKKHGSITADEILRGAGVKR
jgi:predicted transcriptional regulator